MIHAYNEVYLYDVMKNIGAMMDIAINDEKIDADEFVKIFANSDVAKKIENGVPDMLAGKSATEMLSLVLGKQVTYTNISMDRTQEYWAGFVLAKAQWELNVTFKEVINVMPLSRLIGLYHPYHEADEMKAIDMIAGLMASKKTRLKELREKRKLTQGQLATLSQVNIRSIRAYEQGDIDLSKAQGETLLMLSKALCCTIEDLLK